MKRAIPVILIFLLIIIFGLIMGGHPYWAFMVVATPFLAYLSFILISLHRRREKETEDCC